MEEVYLAVCGVIGESSSAAERQLRFKVCGDSQKGNYISAERKEEPTHPLLPSQSLTFPYLSCQLGYFSSIVLNLT